MTHEILYIITVFLQCNALLYIDDVESPPVNNHYENLLWVTYFEKLPRGKPSCLLGIKCSQMFCSKEFIWKKIGDFLWKPPITFSQKQRLVS